MDGHVKRSEINILRKRSVHIEIEILGYEAKKTRKDHGWARIPAFLLLWL